MDNFHIDVVSTGRDEFELAMEIAARNIPGRKVVSYALHPSMGLVLFWSHEKTPFGPEVFGPPFNCAINESEWRRLYEEEKASVVRVPVTPLPYKLAEKGLVDFAWHWLEVADYGPEPNNDGGRRRGWRVYTEKWGRVGNSGCASIAIQPAWALYSK